MAVMRSIVFSVLASVLATLAARRVLSVTGSAGPSDTPTINGGSPVVVIVPVVVGNSNNRIGWVKEEHVHRHSLFPWARD